MVVAAVDAAVRSAAAAVGFVRSGAAAAACGSGAVKGDVVASAADGQWRLRQQQDEKDDSVGSCGSTVAARLTPTLCPLQLRHVGVSAAAVAAARR